MLSWTEEQYQRYLAKQRGEVTPEQKRSKWSNIICRADGFTFDSLAERSRYYELKLLVQAGKIDRLRVHWRWKFADEIYEDDFNYRDLEKGIEIVVEDVKNEANQRDAKFRRKCRMMQKYYGITVRIILAKSPHS